MFQILFQCKNKNDRWLSSSVYKESELKYIEDFKRKEYILRFPDESLLYNNILEEELKNLEILGRVQINLS